MSKKYTAEVGLVNSLRALEQKRKDKAERLRREKPALTSIASASKDDLKEFRFDPEVDGEIHRRKIVAGVRSLPQVAAPYPEDREKHIAKLEDRAIERRRKHHEAFAEMREAMQQNADSVQEQVTSCAQEVHAALSKTLADIEKIFTELGEDSQLASHPMDYIKQAWVQLQALCKQHSELIDSFENSLGGMEVQRSRAIGEQLKKFVSLTVAIGHIMPNEIERLAEEEGHKINIVMLRNSTAYADLIARLRRKDVTLFIDTRK